MKNGYGGMMHFGCGAHAGREYRLCSRACLDKSEANPDQYASNHGGAL